MKEELADLQHQIWSQWMRYLLSHCRTEDGNKIIDKEDVRKWHRLAYTSYNGLTEEEKESSRTDALKVMTILARETCFGFVGKGE